MIEKLTPNTRKQLVESRCLAMQGKLSEVINVLDKTATNARDEGLRLDAIALMMLKAEMLYLDYQSEQALGVFRETIDPELHDLPDEVRLVVADNRNSFATWLDKDSLRQFYVQVDERRIAGVDLWDSSKLLNATNAAEEDKHFEALPLIWNELMRSYMRGSWRSFWVASNYMAKECLQLGWPHEASYHAIAAHNSELAEEIGQQLLQKREPQLIEAAINKVLGSANLHVYATVGCSLVGIIGDAIPEQQLETVFHWLLPWCRQPRRGLNDGGLLEKAWRALSKIIWGLDVSQIREVIKVAVSHPAWSTLDFERRHLVPVVNRCVKRLPIEDLPALTRHVLPLATHLKSDVDFIETVNLLVHMAERGGEAVKSIVAECLFPVSTPVTNSVLAQVAPVFGRQFTDAEGLNKKADQLAKEILLLVQRLKPDEQPRAVSGGFGNTASIKDNQKLVVQNGANTLALGALVKHKHLLSENALRGLIDSIQAALADPDNLISNKIQLIHVLGDFAGELPTGCAESIFTSLLPFAEGKIIEPSIAMSWKEANNPLNPFKMRDANPAGLRGIAIYTLARIEKAKPGTFGNRLSPLLEAALGHTDSEVRRLAFTAAREAPSLSDAGLTAVLMGTRDLDPKAAAAAYYALAEKREFKLSDGQWELLYYTIKLALQAQDTGLRRAAAHATANLASHTPFILKESINGVVNEFAKDICYSVRAAVLERE